VGWRRSRQQAARAGLSRTTEAGRAVVTRVSSSFSSKHHDERLAAILGIALGVSFAICLLTGLVDWATQHGPSWFVWPSRPVNLFRVTQGVHVVTGIATIPLLFAKLWVVYPKLFSWPPIEDVAHLVERISIVPLVGGALFLLFTGVLNIDYTYGPMPFFFPTAHFWAAWLTVGAIVVHVGAKATQVRLALTRDSRGPDPVEEPVVPGAHAASASAPPAGLTRRGFLGVVGATSGLLAVSVAGETVTPISKVSVLAPRVPSIGPQNLPVNQSAIEAGVVQAAQDPNYRLSVAGRLARPVQLTLADLRALEQHESGLPISCVEGWSAPASWRGVPVVALLRLAGAPRGAEVRVESLEAADRLYSSSVLNPGHASDPGTLIALELNGKVLDLDHGYPARLIAPNRPGVQQTKWVYRLVVL
jgi:DMSO/TMAO reductase YedYZ molybdopterin-dependent catalytic subunit